VADLIKNTEQLAKANALKFTDHGNGHVQIEGHGTLVNYWPNSKSRTAHIKNGETVKHCSPWDAVRLCLTKSSQYIKPKKVSKNAPAVELEPIKTNPAGIKNFYNGKAAPWDFDEFIICQSDQLRIDAYKLKVEADQMECLTQ
jgi:hypothetical protein